MKIKSSKKYAFLGLLIMLPTIALAMDLQRNHPLVPCSSYQCSACLDIFFSLKTLSEHNRAMHPISPRPLPVWMDSAITKRKTQKAPRSQRIVRKKHTARACTECGKKCKSDYFLLLHMRKHTGEKLPVCRICNKQFTYKANRDRHEKEVHKKK